MVDVCSQCTDATPSSHLPRRAVLSGAITSLVLAAEALADDPAAAATKRPTPKKSAPKKTMKPPTKPSPATSDVVVVISLRGGFDGLSAVVPASDASYWQARPHTGIPSSRLLPLDARFGLHPAMAPLYPFWNSGALAIVQDVGQADPTRSHFEAMRELERAAPGSSVRTGWLDRVLGLRPRTTPFQGAQVGNAKANGAWAGSFPELALRSVDSMTLRTVGGATLAQTEALYRALYAKAPEVIAAPVRAAMDAVGTTSTLKAAGYRAAVTAGYPDSDFGHALKDVARLIKAKVGLQVACVDVGGWDLHASMGTVDTGAMRDLLADVATSLAAFANDLGTGIKDVTVVTLSEFGRRIAENGSGGTDHGHGNTVFVLGGGAIGKKVYGNWKGLASSALIQGDLPGTTDYRQVLAEILQKRCHLGSAASVFPGLPPGAVGLVRQRT